MGKIDKADLILSECPYDKDAVAFKLIDWGNVRYDKGTSRNLFRTFFKARQRIKILKEKGLSYANVTLPYYSKENYERITKIEAYVYNLADDGTIKVTEVNKSATYVKKINSYYSELIIPLPDVKVGSVIEYQYTLERETMTHIKSWFFQQDLPIRYSEYELTIPLIFKFSIKPSIIDSIDVKEEIVDELLNSSQGVLKLKSLHKKLIMRNLKQLPKDPFMGSTKDYQQRLEFQLSQIDYGDGDIKYLRTSWSEVLTNLRKDEDFGKQLEEDIKKAFPFIDALKLKGSDEQKIEFLFKYFQQNFTWDEQESIYAYQGLGETWDRKTGSSGDINLLFIKLLNDAGVKAFPILFSTRDNGTVNTDFPFVEQFNTVMCIATINQNRVIIDATNKIAPYSLVPQKINNTNGFIAEGTAGKWILATDVVHKYKVIIANSGNIDETGQLNGETLINATGYSRFQRLQTWLNDRNNFQKSYFNSKGNTIKLTDLVINHIEDYTKPLEQKANYSYTLSNSGGYKYFTPNFFTDFNENPFIKDDRLTDIDFGYLQDYQLFGNFTLAPNYIFEELPKNISMVMPDNSILFNRFVEVEDNILSIRITIEFKKTYYTANVYPEFKEFYKKLFEKLNEQIVIKKK